MFACVPIAWFLNFRPPEIPLNGSRTGNIKSLYIWTLLPRGDIDAPISRSSSSTVGISMTLIRKWTYQKQVIDLDRGAVQWECSGCRNIASVFVQKIEDREERA
jgi:hypothetical protein